MTDNDRVQVLAVDYSDHTVKVQYLNGAVDWVSADLLLTESQSRQRDLETGVAGTVLTIGIMYCLFNPEECQN